MSHRSKKVKVWARIRPTAKFAKDELELLSDGKSVNIHLKRDPKKGVVNNQILDWSFKLDGIFHNSSQEKVYDTEISDIVTNALDGYNGTVMCYGQTGAGKTFTITGATESYKNRGIIPRALSQIYREVEERPEYAISIRVSYLEIYNETMFDLLSTLPDSWNSMSPEPMGVIENENGVYVKGLSCHLAQNEEEALNFLFEGETNRAISAHSLNKHSSRSHCIFTVYVEARSRTQSNAKYTVSKLNLVDLAGSERLGKTNSQGKTQQEAMYINKSLTFLEQVIVALADKRREHIPFRQSKLTHCLKDSIGGNCGTILIANVWGELAQMEETVSTLRFATRMMCVASEPAVNEVYDPALLVKKLQKDIVHLKSELAMHDTLTNRTQITYDPLSEQQKYETRQQVRKYLEGGLDEIDIVNIRQIQGVYDAFKEIYLQMEKDVEEKLKEKYMLVDKSDPNSIAAAQKAGALISDDGTLQLVGEPDGQSFGIGQAPKASKADPSAVISAKRSQRDRDRKKLDKHSNRHSPVGGKGISPAHSSKGDRDMKSPHTPLDKVKGGDEKEGEPPGTPSSSIAAPSRSEKLPPSTPPTRTVAFEEFKSELGREINRILTENKEILGQKKKSYADVARQINQTKKDIDSCRTSLDALKSEREMNGITYSEEGEIIITEQEFLLIKQLKELKHQYRLSSDDLKQIKTDVQYCQNLVDQCRKRLILEFDSWYAESFLTNADGAQTSSGVGIGTRPGVQMMTFDPNVVPEDEQEKFDRLQMELLMNNPDSAAFHNAQMRTQRRKTYEQAMSQAQPSYRRNPGLPTVNIRNKPPSILQVSH